MCKSVSGIYKININNKCYIGSKEVVVTNEVMVPIEVIKEALKEVVVERLLPSQ